MGNDNSKKKNGPHITQEQKESILNMLQCVRHEKEKVVSCDVLTDIWRTKLSHGLMQTFLTFLFRNTKIIPLEEFELFYYNLVEASLEERAKTMMALIGIEDNIPPKIFQTFVSDLIETYIMILQSKRPSAYNSWPSGDLTHKSDLSIVANFFIRNITYNDGKLTVDEVENWLRRTAFVKEISETVTKIAFGMEVKELRPILPKADKTSSFLRIPTVLALSHFIRDSEPTWRLLYGSSDEAHSWNIFINRLFCQGPTLVLIQDTGGPLFGGYASNTWRLAPTFYGDENCFIFRLRPELRVCLPTGYNSNFQYLNSGAATLPNGLGMGGQLNYFGFFLSSEFGPGSVSKSCTTFCDYAPLASQLDFKFSRLEVWGVGKPDVIEEGVRSVGGGLIMQRDPGAVALLELAGKTGHAKAAGILPESDDPQDEE